MHAIPTFTETGNGGVMIRSWLRVPITVEACNEDDEEAAA